MSLLTGRNWSQSRNFGRYLSINVRLSSASCLLNNENHYPTSHFFLFKFHFHLISKESLSVYYFCDLSLMLDRFPPNEMLGKAQGRNKDIFEIFRYLIFTTHRACFFQFICGIICFQRQKNIAQFVFISNVCLR